MPTARLLLGPAAALVAVVAPMPWAAAQSPDVEVTDNRFSPPSVTRDAGATVRWMWTGTNEHTVTSADGRFASSERGRAGHIHVVQFAAPGTYDYFCMVHGSDRMSGTVVIRGGPSSSSPSPSPSPSAAASPTAASPRPTPAPAPAPTSVRPSAASATTPGSPSAVPSASAPTLVPTAATATPTGTDSTSTDSTVPALAPTPTPPSTGGAAPLATLDDPLPKDRSGLAIALGLGVAALGFGTAGVLLLRNRPTGSV